MQPAAEPTDIPAYEPFRLTPGVRTRIYLYLGLLIFCRPFTGLSGLTSSFLLKEQLHLSAPALATYGFYVGIPAYFGFLFGLLRDRWAPFGRKDQGLFFIAFGGMTLVYLGLASVEITVAVLFAAAIVRAILDQLASGAQRGLTSVLGQEHVMSGRLSALWQAAGNIPSLIVPILAGLCADNLSPKLTYALTALICMAMFGYACWRPRAVYADRAEAEPIPPRPFWSEAARLARTPAIYPCVALLLLWNFTPGVGTTMQYYLRDTLHASKSEFGLFDGIFGFFFVPTFLLHGYLCTRFRLRTLLWVSTWFAVPQILPLLIVHNAQSAIVAAVPMGLMGGFATAAYFDLLIRACPEGLQGTAMMLGASVWALSGALGDVAGTHLYEWKGFPACAWATAAVYACQLPVLLFVPKRLTATRDGEFDQ